MGRALDELWRSLRSPICGWCKHPETTGDVDDDGMDVLRCQFEGRRGWNDKACIRNFRVLHMLVEDALDEDRATMIEAAITHPRYR